MYKNKNNWRRMDRQGGKIEERKKKVGREIGPARRKKQDG